MNTAVLHPTNFGDEFVEAPRPAFAARSRVVSFRQLGDADKMPFGPYRDRPMSEVPASYLDRLRDAAWLKKWPTVEDYIERNAKAIDVELEEKDRARERRY